MAIIAEEEAALARRGPAKKKQRVSDIGGNKA